MSRGPGARQTSLLLALATRSAPVLQQELIWQLSSDKDIEPRAITVNRSTLDSKRLKPSYVNSMLRAVLQLEAAGLIERSSKRFESFAEIVENAEFLSYDLSVRRMRSSLAPTLLRFPQEVLRRRFSSKAVEDDAISDVESVIERKMVKRLWRRAAQEILQEGLVRNRAWLAVYLRGREIFQGEEWRCTESFERLVRRCSKGGKASDTLQRRLRKLSTVVAAELGGSVQIGEAKRILYEIVDLHQRERIKVRRLAAEWLEDKAPEVIRALPGYGRNPPLPSIQSPLLDRILDRHVLRKNRYLTITEKGRLLVGREEASWSS